MPALILCVIVLLLEVEPAVDEHQASDEADVPRGISLANPASVAFIVSDHRTKSETQNSFFPGFYSLTYISYTITHIRYRYIGIVIWAMLLQSFSESKSYHQVYL